MVYYYVYISIENTQLVPAKYNYLTFFQDFSRNGEKSCKNSAISKKKSHSHNFALNDLKLNQNVPLHR